jgi:hypothetical protein
VDCVKRARKEKGVSHSKTEATEPKEGDTPHGQCEGAETDLTLRDLWREVKD